MAVIDLYSKRRKRERGDVPDGYTYEDFPQTFKVQITQILQETISLIGDPELIFGNIVTFLRKEYGKLGLVEDDPSIYEYNNKYEAELCLYLLSLDEAERILDIIELSCQYIDTTLKSHVSADEAISEINTRFQEHGLGYEFTNGQIIRKDSELIHTEVVKPALTLLAQTGYDGALEEFLGAYDHFRQKKNKEALNDALKAYESTLKIICDKRGWDYDKAKHTSKKLVTICYDNGLIPKYWQENIKAIRGLLEGGISTGRNRTSGHGQGAVPTEVPDHIAAYGLHMTASAIVFLIKSEQALP